MSHHESCDNRRSCPRSHSASTPSPPRRMSLEPPSFRRHRICGDSWKKRKEDSDWGMMQHHQQQPAQVFERLDIAKKNSETTDKRLSGFNTADISSIDDQQRRQRIVTVHAQHDGGDHNCNNHDLSVDIQQQHAILDRILLERSDHQEQQKKMKASDGFADEPRTALRR